MSCVILIAICHYSDDIIVTLTLRHRTIDTQSIASEAASFTGYIYTLLYARVTVELLEKATCEFILPQPFCPDSPIDYNVREHCRRMCSL